MSLQLRRIRAENSAENERLAEVVDRVDSELADAEGDLQTATDELIAAQKEVDALTPKVERLQQQFDDAYEAWYQNYESLPEGMGYSEPNIVSEYGRAATE